MAKKTVNKSEAIRDFLASDPGAMPKAIIEGLKKQGIVVSAALVSAVKYNKAKPAKGRKKKMGRPAGASANGKQVDLDKLVEAKRLADRLGGIEEAKASLEMLRVVSQLLRDRYRGF